jgi:hypothetical protein
MSVRNTQALLKHFQSISEELMKHFKKTLDNKMQFQAFSSIYQARKEH